MAGSNGPWCSTKLCPKLVRSEEKGFVSLFALLFLKWVELVLCCPVQVKWTTLQHPHCIGYKLAAVSSQLNSSCFFLLFKGCWFQEGSARIQSWNLSCLPRSALGWNYKNHPKGIGTKVTSVHLASNRACGLYIPSVSQWLLDEVFSELFNALRCFSAKP